MWGDIELEPEVRAWVEALNDDDFGQVAARVRRLGEEGPLLGEPYTRQLDGKLRELRFFLGRQRFRITYYIASGRRIILLTVFHKTKARETAEVDRARRAMRDCISAGHTAED
ncbi:MAG: type II toxin-antitoxin system RelE/ParE family toxin [Dehalococcoidia bacterium]